MSNNQKWIKPTDRNGSRWWGFLMSDSLDPSAHRRQAQCTHCKEVIQGRPELLYKHIDEQCSSISTSDKSTYYQGYTSEMKLKKRKENPIEESRSNEIISQDGIHSPNTIKVTIPPKSFHMGTLHHFTVLDECKTDELHVLLMKALITGHIPLGFLSNPFFMQYQEALARTPYKLPTRHSMMTKILPFLHSENHLRMEKQLQTEKNLTVSLDGWSDTSKNSVYAVMLLKGTSVKEFVDILDLHSRRHTTLNIHSALKKSFNNLDIKWSSITAIVTDSPSSMISLRRTITTENPHIINVNCCLHVFNLIVKDIVKHPLMSAVVNGNQELVKYFNQSYFYSEHLEQWRAQNNVPRGLATFCDTRWFSLSKVCLSVAEHELGFQKWLELEADPTSDVPAIPEKIRQLINDRDHFTANLALTKFLRLVVDALAELEHANTCLSDIWYQLAYVYTEMRKLEVYDRYHEFKDHCIQILHKRSQAFKDNIYIISLFLIPTQIRFATPRGTWHVRFT